MCEQSTFPSSRKGTLFLEQRVHHVAYGGEQSRHHANHVPRPVPHIQGALEPNDRRSCLQRTKNLHGNELEALRRTDGQLQGREAEVRIKW